MAILKLSHDYGIFEILMKISVSLFLFLIVVIVYSQSPIVELSRLYKLYEDKCDNETDSALIYIKEAHGIATYIKSNDWLSKTNYGLGFCYYLKQEYSHSIFYAKESLKYAEISQNKNISSRSYTLIGQINSLRNDYPTALKNFHKSLKISEKLDFTDNKIITYTYMGDIFVNEKDSIQSLKYYHKAKSIGEKTRSKKLDRVYSNLGVFYMGNQKDSALIYFNYALKLYQQNNNLYGEINSRINIAVTILNFKSENDYSEAFKQLKKANDLALLFKNPNTLFFSYYFLGVYYETADQNVSKAKPYYDKSLELIKKGYKSEYTIQLYKSLSRVARKQGDYKTAYEYQVKSQTLQDSIFSVEKNKQFHEIQTKFDVEQKNNRIQLLNKENEIQSRQKLWIFISASVLVLFFIIIAYIYKKEAKSQKIIRKQDLQLFEKERETAEQQKKLSEIKYLIAGQNKERSRISKELHDGIGSAVAAIKMNLAMLNQNVIQNTKLDIQIEQLDNLSKEIRVISHSLNIGIDSEKSLLELINDLIEINQFDRKFEMYMNVFPEDCLDDLDDFFKINLYRIFQEAFANISKHSQAQKVEISCTFHDDELTIIIEDDGIGFEPHNPQGIGIKNIKERTKELKGNVHIDSRRDHGTTISLHLPKPPHE